MLQLFKLVA